MRANPSSQSRIARWSIYIATAAFLFGASLGSQVNAQPGDAEVEGDSRRHTVEFEEYNWHFDSGNAMTAENSTDSRDRERELSLALIRDRIEFEEYNWHFDSGNAMTVVNSTDSRDREQELSLALIRDRIEFEEYNWRTYPVTEPDTGSATKHSVRACDELESNRTKFGYCADWDFFDGATVGPIIPQDNQTGGSNPDLWLLEEPGLQLHH